MNETFEQLIQSVPESRIRTIAWASENKFITKDTDIVDYNEFNIIVNHEGKLWNIQGGGHNFESIEKEENKINNNHYATKTNWV